MSATVEVIPGVVWDVDDDVTAAKLNLTANPTVSVEVNVADITDYSNVTPTTKTFTVQDQAGDILRVAAGHGASVGQSVKVSTSSALPTGLSASYEYFLRPDVSNPATDFTLHYTAYGAANNLDRVDVSSAGTGTQTLTYYSYASGAPLIFDSGGSTWEKGLVSADNLPEYQSNSSSVPGIRGAVPGAPPTSGSDYYLNPRGVWTQLPTPSNVGNDLYLNENVY